MAIIDDVVFNLMYKKFISPFTFKELSKSQSFDIINMVLSKTPFDILKNDKFILMLCSGRLDKAQINAIFSALNASNYNNLCRFIDLIESGNIRYFNMFRAIRPQKLQIIMETLLCMDNTNLQLIDSAIGIYTYDQKLTILKIIDSISIDQLKLICSSPISNIDLYSLLECISLLDERAINTLSLHIDKILSMIGCNNDDIMFDIIDMCTGQIDI